VISFQPCTVGAGLESTSFESPAAAAAGCLASGCGRGVRGWSVAGPCWPAVAAAAGGGGLASSDGTRQQRQLTRSVIVIWYERYR